MTACLRCTEDLPACATKPFVIGPGASPPASGLFDGSGHHPHGAAYTAGIVGNHPFVDGNKRTGFVIGVLFLELNGYRFTTREEDAAQAVLSLAAGILDEEEYSLFLRSNTAPEG